MTIQQTERAREASPIERLAEHLAARPMPICSDDMRIMLVADRLDYSLNRCGLVVVPEQALTPQPPSEEVVEAVARAICKADGKTWRERSEKPSLGLPHDYDFDRLNNHWRHKARAAIAAMPSIPQESDAEVTEEMLEAGYRAAKEDGLTGPRKSCEALVKLIYTAMTSARDRQW